VLVVDDNATNRRILTMQLSSFGAAAIEAPGSVEALQLLGERGQHFDLAVLDLVMPVLDGVQLAGAIRRTRGLEKLPVILLSSLGRRLQPDEEDLFVAVLTKPVRSVPLMESFARAIEESEQEPPHEGAPVLSRTAPVTQMQPAATVPAQSGPRAPAAPEPSAPLRILLAEDNEVNQKVGRLMLAKLGHQAEIVGNGQLALEAVRAQDYDVILMDMHMPVMDGLEATRQIRADLPAHRQPIIIAMTASVTMEDREACAEAGMNDYLSKPVRTDGLAALLDRVAATRAVRG